MLECTPSQPVHCHMLYRMSLSVQRSGNQDSEKKSKMEKEIRGQVHGFCYAHGDQVSAFFLVVRAAVQASLNYRIQVLKRGAKQNVLEKVKFSATLLTVMCNLLLATTPLLEYILLL